MTVQPLQQQQELTPGKGFKTHGDARREALAYIKGRRDGTIQSLKTPWAKYNDAHVDGLEYGRIITLAGMSGSGKSAIGNQLEKELHLINPSQEFAILNFNFDMASTDIILRNTIAEFSISNKQLLSAHGNRLPDHLYTQIEKYLSEINDNPNIFYCEYPKTPDQYYNLCHYYYKSYGKALVIMTDHSVLFKRAASDNSQQDTLYGLADKSLRLKKEIPCIQIHFSQLNRTIEEVERRKKNSSLNFPMKKDIFGSDALYMASDTVLVNHRPCLLGLEPDSYGPNKWPVNSEDIYWHYLKLRQGDPHVARMTGDFANMRILD